MKFKRPSEIREHITEIDDLLSDNRPSMLRKPAEHATETGRADYGNSAEQITDLPDEKSQHMEIVLGYMDALTDATWLVRHKWITKR